MQDFVSEGRVTENSLITNAPESGYFHAIAYDVFKLWSGTGQAVAVGAEAQTYQQTAPYTPQYTVPEPVVAITEATTEHSHATSNAPTNVFLVMAEIRSGGCDGIPKSFTILRHCPAHR